MKTVYFIAVELLGDADKCECIFTKPEWLPNGRLYLSSTSLCECCNRI